MSTLSEKRHTNFQIYPLDHFAEPKFLIVSQTFLMTIQTNRALLYPAILNASIIHYVLMDISKNIV